MAAENWGPVGPDLETIRSECADPLYALSQAEMPAIMLRGAYDSGSVYSTDPTILQHGIGAQS